MRHDRIITGILVAIPLIANIATANDRIHDGHIHYDQDVWETLAPAAAIDKPKRGFDDGLGIGSRYERVGADFEIQPPKGALSDYPSDRLAGDPPFDETGRPAADDFVDRRIIAQRQPRRVESQREF